MDVAKTIGALGHIRHMRNTRKLLVDHPELTPVSVFRMLWKQKIWTIAIGTLLGASGGYIVSKQQAFYRAESLVLVDSQKIPEKFVASTVQMSLQDRLSLISQQILSTTRLQKIIEAFNLYPEQRKIKSPEEIMDLMHRDLEINVEKGWGNGKPGAFRVAYVGPDPVVAAGVVNQVSGLFIEENLKSRELQAIGTSEFIDSQLKIAKNALDEQEAKVSVYKRRWIGELPEQQTALVSSLARMQTQLQGNQDAANRAQQSLDVLSNSLHFAEADEANLRRAISQAQTPVVVSAGGQPVMIIPSQPVVKASDKIRADLAASRTRHNDLHPEVRRLQAELAAALEAEAHAAQLAAANPPPSANPTTPGAPKTIIPVVPPQLATDLNRQVERVATIKIQIAALEKEIKERGAERQGLIKSLADYQSRVEQLPVREQEMAALTRDYEISKQNYKSLLDKKISASMSTEMEKAQQSERFTLQDPARPPARPSRPNRPMLYGMVAVGSLLIALLVPLAFEFRKNTVLGEWEFAKDIPILGRVPLIDPSAKPKRENLQIAMAPGSTLAVILAVAARFCLGRGF